MVGRCTQLAVAYKAQVTAVRAAGLAGSDPLDLQRRDAASSLTHIATKHTREVSLLLKRSVPGLHSGY